LAYRERLRALITIKESPHRLAMSFSVGVFIGMSPFLGFHTLLGLIVVWIFRLNTFSIIAGVYITNPWTIVPIYAFSTWVGAKFLGIKEIIPAIDWSHITFSHFLTSLKPLLIPFIFGTFLTGFFTAVISYVIIYRFVKSRYIQKKIAGPF